MRVLTFLTAIILIAAGCAPVTKATLKSAKGPQKGYVIKSVDSAFLTDQDYVIVYTTVTRKKKDFVQMATFKVKKTGTNNSDNYYVPFGVMDNSTYKTEAKGEVTTKLIISNNSSEIFQGDKSPSILIENDLPNKTALISVYAHPDDEEWGRYSIALKPHQKIRRPYMYPLLAPSVVADAAVTGGVIAAGAIAAVVWVIGLIF